MAEGTGAHKAKLARNGRRWVVLIAAAALITAPSLVVMTIRAAPARAWDVEGCVSGDDCPGDPSGGSLGLDEGDCLWDSCGDGSQAGDPDPSDECTDTSCQDDQNPPVKQCIIIIKPDGTILCIDNQQGDPDPPPPVPIDCSDAGVCPDPITEDPIDPSTCAPDDYGTDFTFNQDNFIQDTLTSDPFPDMDPLYNDMCPPPPVPPPAPTQFGATDVAFGDSFISGEGQGPFDSNVPGGAACDVADTAWPNLAYGTGGAVGAVFGIGSNKPFENWSCSGATIDNTTNEINSAITAGSTDDNVTHNRFAGLGRDTARVQILAGGDDLNFGPALTCAYSVFRHDDNTHKMNGNQTCIPDPADPHFHDQVNALIPRLTTLYELAANIPASANGASGPTVEAISYPMFFPVGNDPRCGWDQTGITRADQVWINADALLLDNAIRRAAADAGVDFIDFSTALQGASICDNPRGMNTVSDIGGFTGHLRGAFHPNVLGHQRMLASYLRQNFFGVAGFSATTPADGTLVGDRAGDQIYVAAGGSLFPFAKQADVSNSIYSGANIILEPSNQIAAQVSTKPADGTLLKDASTGAIFAVSGGALVPLAPTQIMLPAITVPSQSLNGYPIASGDFFKVAGGDGTVYESVGGAPVPVTDWSHVGGPQPTGTLSQGQFDNMRPVPPDGTFVSATQPGTSITNNYEFAGGAPIFVSDFSHVGGQPATAPIPIDQTAIDDAGSGGAFNHIRQLPADGTFVTATDPATSTVNAYVFAGGAPIYISDWSHVGGQPTGTIAAVDQTAFDNAGSGGVYNHVRPTPPDGTYVNGQGSGGALVESYVFAGGAPIPITDWTHLGGPAAGTPPSNVNPVSVDENALDNAGSGGPYNHVRQTPADGTFLAGNADKINGIFVTAGGAPIYVSNFEDVGGARGSTSVDQTAIDDAGTGGIFNHLRAKPADGTLVESFGTGHIFVIAGGAPLEVTSLANIGSPAQTPTFVDQVALDKAGSGGFYNHLNFKPADNTLIAGNATNYFVVAGGAPIYVPYLEDIGGARGFVTVDQAAIDKAGSGGDWNHMSFQPANGTIIESFNTGKVYQVLAGVPTLDCSASQTFLYIDQFALDKAGTGGFYNHLKPLPKPAPAPCPPPPPSGDPGPL